MFGPAIGLAALVSLYASGAYAQAKWAKGQVNTTICEWQQLRGEPSDPKIFNGSLTFDSARRPGHRLHGWREYLVASRHGGWDLWVDCKRQ